MKLKPKYIDLNMNVTLSMLEIKRVRDKLSKKKNWAKPLILLKNQKVSRSFCTSKTKKAILEKKQWNLSKVCRRKKKEKRDAEVKEGLLRELDDFEGLGDINMDDTKHGKFSSNKEKRIALKIQPNFWQKVIGVKCGKRFFTL